MATGTGDVKDTSAELYTINHWYKEGGGRLCSHHGVQRISSTHNSTGSMATGTGDVKGASAELYTKHPHWLTLGRHKQV